MKKMVLLIGLCIFIVGCSTNQTEEAAKESEKETPTSEQEKEEKSTEAKKEEAKKEEEKKKEDKESEEKNEKEEKSELKEEAGDLFKDGELTIPKKDIDSPFGEDGNIKNQHTEQEIVEEYMDDEGRIYFDLDDDPIRSITNEDETINNITNYSDAYIDMNEEVAYVLPEESISFAYDFFISNPPEDLRDKEPEDYRSWEEATNLERGIMQITLLTSVVLNETDSLMEQDKYSGKEMESIQEEFFELGSPNILIPAPQSALDMQLFENMLMVQGLWEKFGKFENPEDNKEEFEAVYQELRQEMNNIVIRVNYTLSEDVVN